MTRFGAKTYITFFFFFFKYKIYLLSRPPELPNSGFGNSGGCGSGPTVFGWRLYAISQQDTAIATATRASSAVIINATMKPIIDTHMSSTL